MAGSTHTAENGGGAVGTKPARGDDLHQGSGEHRFPWLLRLPVLCSALVQVSTLVYLNSLDGGIVYDDKPVLRNPDVTGARPLSAMWYHDFWGYAMWGDSWTHLSYRPLVVLTLRLNRMTGLGLPGMHATNIAIHAGVVILALFLCMALFPSSRRAEAAAAALLFAVHPIHTEVRPCASAHAGVSGRRRRCVVSMTRLCVGCVWGVCTRAGCRQHHGAGRDGVSCAGAGCAALLPPRHPVAPSAGGHGAGRRPGTG